MCAIVVGWLVCWFDCCTTLVAAVMEAVDVVVQSGSYSSHPILVSRAGAGRSHSQRCLLHCHWAASVQHQTVSTWLCHHACPGIGSTAESPHVARTVTPAARCHLSLSAFEWGSRRAQKGMTLQQTQLHSSPVNAVPPQTTAQLLSGCQHQQRVHQQPCAAYEQQVEAPAVTKHSKGTDCTGPCCRCCSSCLAAVLRHRLQALQ